MEYKVNREIKLGDLYSIANDIAKGLGLGTDIAYTGVRVYKQLSIFPWFNFELPFSDSFYVEGIVNNDDSFVGMLRVDDKYTNKPFTKEIVKRLMAEPLAA